MSETINLPLAEQLRPQSIDEVIGQQHLLSPGKPLHLAMASKHLSSMVLWGPPGVGKTTLARLLAKNMNYEFQALSAVFAGIKEIKQAIELAQRCRSLGRKTILFIDEIHRFNKAQQDALLPHTESGLLTLIGATTENPSFEVNHALLSRSQVYVLKPLTESELQAVMARATAHAMPELVWDEESTNYLTRYADGDARRMLNALEPIFHAFKASNQQTVTPAFIESILGSTLRGFDKGGDFFYDHISALHKSVRGSDPDAALYWLCCMLEAGASGLYLARRIIRMAWEDIGLADPRAMQIANEAANTYERLGSPEGELALAQAVTFLAVAPKSNAGYLAYKRARSFVKKATSHPVPMHLRNAPTRLMKNLGHGEAYRYPHDEPYGFAAGQCYFPEELERQVFYQPVDRGLERQIKEKLEGLRRLDKEEV